ncbi:uncharacterized protein [Amphiura filiformis]|uniref:uncharacterized protein isoform X6 n=1 Tax=Amphiura filiformis TaxID=82378 RepID=UPI003B21FCA3
MADSQYAAYGAQQGAAQQQGYGAYGANAGYGQAQTAQPAATAAAYGSYGQQTTAYGSQAGAPASTGYDYSQAQSGQTSYNNGAGAAQTHGQPAATADSLHTAHMVKQQPQQILHMVKHNQAGMVDRQQVHLAMVKHNPQVKPLVAMANNHRQGATVKVLLQLVDRAMVKAATDHRVLHKVRTVRVNRQGIIPAPPRTVADTANHLLHREAVVMVVIQADVMVVVVVVTEVAEVAVEVDSVTVVAAEVASINLVMTHVETNVTVVATSYKKTLSSSAVWDRM